MQVPPAGSSLEYDCGSGSIDQPLIADAAGEFEANGRHIPGRGGPARLGEGSPASPAHYKGRVRGDRMTLVVELHPPEGPMQSMTYKLVAGSQGRVVLCLGADRGPQLPPNFSRRQVRCPRLEK